MLSAMANPALVHELFPDLPALEELPTSPTGVPLIGFRTAGAAASAYWSQLYGAWPKTGLYPLLVAPDVPQYFDEAEETASCDELVAAAAELDGEELLERWATEGSFSLPDWSGEDGEPKPWEDEDPGPFGRDVLRLPVALDWRPDGSTTVIELPVLLVLIPCAEACEVPARLGYTTQSWSAAQHVAVLRHLHKLYGAVPATMSARTMDLALERPPRTDDEALAAARYYEAYNDGSYDWYRSSTRPNLAAKLKENQVWSAWWD
jgi:hypothetical protein